MATNKQVIISDLRKNVELSQDEKNDVMRALNSSKHGKFLNSPYQSFGKVKSFYEKVI